MSKVERDKGLIWLSLLQASIHMRCFRQGQQLPVPEAFILAQGGQAYWGSRAFSSSPAVSRSCLRSACKGLVMLLQAGQLILDVFAVEYGFRGLDSRGGQLLFNFLRPGIQGVESAAAFFGQFGFPPALFLELFHAFS